MFRCSVACVLLAVAIATQDGVLRFHPKQPLHAPSDPSNVMCPDKQGSCPKYSTCCMMPSGKYGCCPMPDAVCCKDNEHCCPAKTQCDLIHQLCTPSADSLFEAPIPMFTKVPALPNTGDNIVCPDKKSTCPKGSTCCLLTSGQFGCCPLDEAVCCDDGEHCCPHGYTCDSSAGTCSKKEATRPQPIAQPTSVICPDQKSMCDDGQTCCLLASGDYACCPLPNAVCCDDHRHCCPSGTTCSTGTGQCLRGNVVTDWVAKQPSIRATTPIAEEYECPDKVSTCPTGTTCCEMLNGHYGCCPMPNAVCCSDKLHCCAEGETCNTETGQCDNHHDNTRLPWQQKMPANTKPGVVVCPDGSSQCPTGSTCCQLATGQYACCPLPKAVCCSDHVHCCPDGYTCDAGSCSRGDISVPWQQKTPAVAKQPEEVVCPGGTASCPDNTTCCLLKSGGYGCCPYPQATCCSDGEHCCPHGYTCDPTSSTCKMSLEPVKILLSDSPQNVQCDETHECPSGSTCCKLPSGQFGCCPYVQATCCSDGLHCCPHGMTCDLSSQTCQSTSNSLAFTWSAVKRPSAFLLVKRAAVVNCPDGSQCPSSTTCCAVEEGKYGCCPYPKATCCDDNIHCCPEGYQCHSEEGTCVKPGSSLTLQWSMFTRNLAIHGGDVQCDDPTVTCPDGSTCCRLVTGQYGCCPLPNAVCCADGQHCCPQGTTCDVASGRCLSADHSVPWAEKMPAKESAEESAEVDCPDTKYHCPRGRTCCKMAGGFWGCCPYEKAVCCSDGRHCCPHGYTCDALKASCLKEGQAVDALLSAINSN